MPKQFKTSKFEIGFAQSNSAVSVWCYIYFIFMSLLDQPNKCGWSNNLMNMNMNKCVKWRYLCHLLSIQMIQCCLKGTSQKNCGCAWMWICGCWNLVLKSGLWLGSGERHPHQHPHFTCWTSTHSHFTRGPVYLKPIDQMATWMLTNATSLALAKFLV